MSLFPAYATEPCKNVEVIPRLPDADLGKDAEDSTSCEEWSGPAALERQLLASDEEPPERPAPAPPAPARDFYVDTELDRANLRVSTLYYPGRPEYRRSGAPLGAADARPAARRRRRYWQGAAPADADDAAERAARAAALRAELAGAPRDRARWLQYVRLEAERGAAAGLEAARAAAAACPRAAARAALHAARERALPRPQLLAELRAELAAERRPRARAELWARLLCALGPAGAAGAARAALATGAGAGAAHAWLVYAHGCVLRAAGLAEQVTLAVELAAAMSFPPAPGFPPPRDEAAERRRRDHLHAREEEVCRSGLPLSTVWARVERLRGAAHWRPAPGDAAGDPQRAPDAAAAAELVRAVRGPRAAAALAAALLRLARVPLPGGEAAARAAGPEPAAGEPALAEPLAALLRTARRLPPAHPARPPSPAAARAALAPLLDPPHYFSDADGYLSWTSALFEACCGWAEGSRRLAFLCWRLRWLHMLARLAEPAEARRLRGEARAAVKRHAAGAPEAAAHFARLEADVCGAAAGARAARAAARAALREPGAPPERALFAARVLAELAGEAPAARWALCCAALRRALPPDAELEAPPPPELRAAALRRAEAACEELEARFAAAAAAAADSDSEEEDPDAEGAVELCSALLPGAGEWAAARAALASPAERERLLARLLAQRHLYRRGAALQFGEQAACALAAAAPPARRAAAARALLPHYPRNPLLALLCAGAPLWAGAGPAAGAGSAGGARAAAAAALPSLLRAPLTPGTSSKEAARLARLAARAGAAAGALLAALRLEAAPAAPALYAALDAFPDHKWLYVRGAAWCGAEAGALADALLERGLRARTLHDELPLLAPGGAGDPR